MRNRTLCFLILLMASLALPMYGTALAQNDTTPPAFDADNKEVSVQAPESVPEKQVPDESKEAADQFIEMRTDEITPQENAGEGSENLISITLDKVPLEDVVRMFMRISDVNIIVAVDETNLLGTVTANLNDVKWEDAFKNILNNHNLDLEERPLDSGMFTIVDKKPGALESLVVQTLFLSYASVGSVAKKDGVAWVVNQMLDPRGKVSEFPSRNAMVVRTTATNLREIQKTIEEIDKLRDQVFIEAKFMELDDAAITDLGINWQVLQGYGIGIGNLNRSYSEQKKWDRSSQDSVNRYDQRNRTDESMQYFDEDGARVAQEEYIDLPEGMELTGMPDKQTVPTRTIEDTITEGRDISSLISDQFSETVNDIRTAVLGIDDFRILLSALKQIQGVEVVSNPKIIVANEETAIIHIGKTERPFIATVTPATENSAPFTTYNPGEPVNFGVELSVTPTVNTESNITVKIEPVLTRSVGEKIAPNGQSYPVVASKRIKTSFCLESGTTVAIGGLTETVEADRTTKIPLLGSIPLIGKYLFSHTSKEKSQSETIIFVTVGLAMPGGIDANEGLPQDTRLTQRALLRRDLRRTEANEELASLKNAASTEKDQIIQKDKKAKLRLLRKRQ